MNVNDFNLNRKILYDVDTEADFNCLNDISCNVELDGLDNDTDFRLDEIKLDELEDPTLVISENECNLLDDICVSEEEQILLKPNESNEIDLYESMNISDFDNDDSDGGDNKVLTREITYEIAACRNKDTETVLENFRENLRDYGVDEERINEFIIQEREKIASEYESMDNGDTFINVCEVPNDWEEVATNLMNTKIINEQFDENGIENQEERISLEQLNNDYQNININYEGIYEDIEQNSLEEGIENYPIEIDSEQLDNLLDNFDEFTWEEASLNEHKEAINNLAEYVVDSIGFKHPPKIEYYYEANEGNYGGYNTSTNTLNINEYMLYNSSEAADTIAHELWHAHQYECAEDLQNPRDYQYRYNFENYINPELGQEAYENQLVEAEARAYASQYKDMLSLSRERIR